jgi:hypothetical protein
MAQLLTLLNTSFSTLVFAKVSEPSSLQALVGWQFSVNMEFLGLAA